jgi:hypothetical protein
MKVLTKAVLRNKMNKFNGVILSEGLLINRNKLNK